MMSSVAQIGLHFIETINQSVSPFPARLQGYRNMPLHPAPEKASKCNDKYQLTASKTVD